MPLAAWASPLSAMIGGMDIAVIGSNMVDLIAYIDRMPAEGETVRTPDFQMGCGGKGANQAVAASRLGAVVLMVTRVGNDLFADNTIANFEAHGIDTTHVLRTEATSGVAPIFVDPQSRNSIIIIPGANDHLSPADIDAAADDIARCRLIVLQLEVPLETVYHAVEFGRTHGVPVLLNPAPANAELDFARIASVDWFVPNETELALLTGLPVDSLDEVDAAASALLARGMTNVLVTLGARGVAWYSEAGRVLTDAETELLQLQNQEDLAVAVIVRAQDGTNANPASAGLSANFMAPLVINTRARLGLQKVIGRMGCDITLRQQD